MKLTVILKNKEIINLYHIDSYSLDAMHELTYLEGYKFHTLHDVYGVACAAIEEEENNVL